MCEDVRQESANKLSYLGVFGNGIRLADASLPLERLALVFALSQTGTLRKLPEKARFELIHVETGKQLSSFEVDIPTGGQRSESAILYFLFSMLKLDLGTYRANLLVPSSEPLGGSFGVSEDASLRPNESTVPAVSITSKPPRRKTGARPSKSVRPIRRLT